MDAFVNHQASALMWRNMSPKIEVGLICFGFYALDAYTEKLLFASDVTRGTAVKTLGAKLHHGFVSSLLKMLPSKIAFLEDLIVKHVDQCRVCFNDSTILRSELSS